MPTQTSSSRTLSEVLDDLSRAGFQVSRETDGRARIEKGGCGCVLETVPDGRIRFAQPPGFLIGGHIAHLEDRGFQKFLVTTTLRLPALAEHLKSVHQFSEEMKAALGLKSLYNESLGTVSDRYLYDRVAGRP